MKHFSQLETWTLQELRPKLIEHYAKMAMNPGSIDQARWRVRELEKDSSGLWIGIGNEVAAKIKELKHEKKEIQT